MNFDHYVECDDDMGWISINTLLCELVNVGGLIKQIHYFSSFDELSLHRLLIGYHVHIRQY